MPRIGELLIAEGILSEGAVRSALGFQRHTGEPFRLGTILLDRDLLAEESLLKALSAIHRCDYATWPQILKAGPQIVRICPSAPPCVSPPFLTLSKGEASAWPSRTHPISPRSTRSPR